MTTGKKDNSSLSSITQRIEEEDIPYILKGKVEKKFFDQKKKNIDRYIIQLSFIYMYDKVQNDILIFISCFVNHSFLAMSIMHHDDKWSYFALQNELILKQ